MPPLFRVINLDGLLGQFPGDASADIAFNQGVSMVFRQRVVFALQAKALDKFCRQSV